MRISIVTFFSNRKILGFKFWSCFYTLEKRKIDGTECLYIIYSCIIVICADMTGSKIIAYHHQSSLNQLFV